MIERAYLAYKGSRVAADKECCALSFSEMCSNYSSTPWGGEGIEPLVWCSGNNGNTVI